MTKKIAYNLQRVKNLYLSGLSADSIFKILKKGSAVTLKKLIARMKAGKEPVTISAAEEATRTAPPNFPDAQRKINKDYTTKKATYTDELIEEIDTLTKDPKNKTIKQVETKLFKKFNTPEYNKTPTGVDSQNVFYNKKKKFFSIPRDYEIYGGAYGKKKVAENQTALKQIIGTKFFANNPNYSKVAGLLTAFYTDPESEFNKKEIDSMRKFVKDFSITRSVKGDTIPSRFFGQLNFDFGRKLKDLGKIFNISEYLQEQIKNPKVSNADKIFYRTELNQILDNRKGLLSRLSEKYPNLFKYKVSPSGNLQFEHRVARALGETGDVKLPKNYIARGKYVPGRFNQAKYFAYDKPLMELISEYNTATKSEKPNVQLKIENLTKDFNRRSGNFLKGVSFDFKNNVKIKETAPLASQVKDADLLMDIDKSLEQSNKFFRSFGDERLKGMPKASAASDFVTSGKEYNEFKKLVNAVKKAPQACRAILDYQTGGISQTCATAIQEDPVRAATKLEEIKPTSAALGKVRNAASAFLKFAGKGKTFGATAAVGALGGALVKQFRNDDPTTYLTNDKQANAMLLDTADQLEREERMRAVGDAPELLDESAIGAELGLAAAAVPGSKKLFDARKKKGFGAVRAGLGPVGKALSGFATPLGIAATTPLNVASQVYAGDSIEDIATNPLNYLGPAFAGTLTREATRGMSPTSTLSKALRLGMNPATIRTASKFFGLPGLALSLGYEGYDQYKKYTEGRGFVYNLLNKDE